MIARISIKNFRSHDHTVLDFHAGVNVIIGKGQAGKTNVKRALEWVWSNRPLGTRFISWWANGDPTEVEVDVQTPEGLHTVTMTKAGNSSATYKVMGPGWREPTVYETVGTKVPDMVRRVLNLDAVNMQAQLDQPYMITGSKGDISRAVNRVIQIEVADKWMGELNSRASRNTTYVNMLKTAIETQQANVDRLADLPKAEEYLVAAEQVEIKLDVVRRRAEVIAELVNAGAHAEKVMERLNQQVTPVDKLLSMAERTQEAIDTARLTVDWIDALRLITKAMDEREARYQVLADQYVALLDELGQCPTCLSPVDAHIIDQLKEAL